MNMENITEITKHVFEFYSLLCPNTHIEIHIASAAYLHNGNIIREGEFIARVVVMDPKNSEMILCKLVERSGDSPQNALLQLFDGYNGPIFKALEKLEPIDTRYYDLMVIKLPKEGTKEYREYKDKIENLSKAINDWNNVQKVSNCK